MYKNTSISHIWQEHIIVSLFIWHCFPLALALIQCLWTRSRWGFLQFRFCRIRWNLPHVSCRWALNRDSGTNLRKVRHYSLRWIGKTDLLDSSDEICWMYFHVLWCGWELKMLLLLVRLMWWLQNIYGHVGGSSSFAWWSWSHQQEGEKHRPVGPGAQFGWLDCCCCLSLPESPEIMKKIF